MLDALNLVLAAAALIGGVAAYYYYEDASLLLRVAPAPVADAFCASRLAEGGHLFILDRTLPAS